MNITIDAPKCADCGKRESVRLVQPIGVCSDCRKGVCAQCEPFHDC